MNGGNIVRKMPNDELEEWFWWMLRYTKNFTSSYAALHEWLNTEVEEEDDINPCKGCPDYLGIG